MNIGSEAYFKRDDGTFVKVKIVDIETKTVSRYTIHVPDSIFRQNIVVTSERLIPDYIYNSALFKTMLESEKARLE